MTETGLIADIGGTNARFALTRRGEDVRTALGGAQVMRCEEFDGPVEAAKAFIDSSGLPAPSRAALCVAAPITGDTVDLTNNPWSFSIEDTRTALGLDSLRVVNDFAAIALALRHFTDDDRIPIGPAGSAAEDAPIAVLGPGTGLGVSGLVPERGGRWVPLQTEGGHATAAPADEREARVLECLRERFGHVSAERVVSGPGLVNLYGAVCALDGTEAERLSPSDVTERALEGNDAACTEALRLFASFLGTTAGNLALTLGARGGVYLAGGIAPRLGRRLEELPFRQRFEAKGRFTDYLAAIPTWIVTHRFPAFVGLADLVWSEA